MSFGNHLFLLLKARQLLTYLCIPYIYMGYLHISMYLFCLFVFLFFSLRYGFLFYWPSLCMCRCLDVLKFAWGPVHVGGWHWEICLNGHELDFIVSCVNCISFVCYIWKKKKKKTLIKKKGNTEKSSREFQEVHSDVFFHFVVHATVEKKHSWVIFLLTSVVKCCRWFISLWWQVCFMQWGTFRAFYAFREGLKKFWSKK